MIRVSGKKRQKGEGRFFPQIAFILSGLLICLWFSLGDGFPFYSRYLLIVYIAYAILPVTVFSENDGAEAMERGTADRKGRAQ